MSTMTCNGYSARVEFDERDNLFVGRVLGLRDIISFHGETVTQLRREFAVAIKDYLKDCAERGVDAQRPASGRILLRVSPELHSSALVRAQSKGKSLNVWVNEVLERTVGASNAN